jgi:hypothetical protein
MKAAAKADGRKRTQGHCTSSVIRRPKPLIHDFCRIRFGQREANDKTYKPKKTPPTSDDKSDKATDYDSNIQIVPASIQTKSKKPKKKKVRVRLENSIAMHEC